MKLKYFLPLLSLYFCLVFGTSESFSEKKELELSSSQVKKNLEMMLPQSVEILSVEEADIFGYFEVHFKNTEPLYISKDGKYLFTGDIYEITNEGLINRSETRRNFLRKTAINQLDKSEFITFQPKNVLHSVFVFTDVDCGYCRQFHKQITDYLELGIQINYLAFPREGLDSNSFNKTVSAWCSSEPNKAITELKLGYEIEEKNCPNNPVEKHFNLGNSLGVSGTPSIITSGGRLIPGYLPPKDLIELLNS